jgi:hypothetical protein
MQDGGTETAADHFPSVPESGARARARSLSFVDELGLMGEIGIRECGCRSAEVIGWWGRNWCSVAPFIALHR